MPKALALGFVFGILPALVACRAFDEGGSRAARQDTVVEKAVATVGGHPIGVADVQARMALDGIGPKEAAEALVREELLLQDARARGMVSDAEAERELDRKMVRALLRDLEAGNEPRDISAEAVRAEFEQHPEVYQIPGRRSVSHLLAKERTEASEALATEALEEARRSDDPVAALKQYAADHDPQSGVEVTVESLPPMTETASFKKSFKNAVFAAKSTGPLKKPVRTSYGWHAIVVTDIEPGEKRNLREVEEEIREGLSLKARFETMAMLVQALEEEGLVVYEKANVDRLMSASEVPARAK